MSNHRITFDIWAWCPRRARLILVTTVTVMVAVPTVSALSLDFERDTCDHGAPLSYQFDVASAPYPGLRVVPPTDPGSSSR